MLTKEELLAELRRREAAELHSNMPIADYMIGVVKIVFDLTAETLAGLKDAGSENADNLTISSPPRDGSV